MHQNQWLMPGVALQTVGQQCPLVAMLVWPSYSSLHACSPCAHARRLFSHSAPAAAHTLVVSFPGAISMLQVRTHVVVPLVCMHVHTISTSRSSLCPIATSFCALMCCHNVVMCRSPSLQHSIVACCAATTDISIALPSISSCVPSFPSHTSPRVSQTWHAPGGSGWQVKSRRTAHGQRGRMRWRVARAASGVGGVEGGWSGCVCACMRASPPSRASPHSYCMTWSTRCSMPRPSSGVTTQPCGFTLFAFVCGQ